MTTPMSSSPTNLNPESVEPFYQYPQPISMSVSPGQDMSTFSPGTFGGTPISGFTPGRPRIFLGLSISARSGSLTAFAIRSTYGSRRVLGTSANGNRSAVG